MPKACERLRCFSARGVAIAFVFVHRVFGLPSTFVKQGNKPWAFRLCSLVTGSSVAAMGGTMGTMRERQPQPPGLSSDAAMDGTMAIMRERQPQPPGLSPPRASRVLPAGEFSQLDILRELRQLLKFQQFRRQHTDATMDLSWVLCGWNMVKADWEHSLLSYDVWTAVDVSQAQGILDVLNQVSTDKMTPDVVRVVHCCKKLAGYLSKDEPQMPWSVLAAWAYVFKGHELFERDFDKEEPLPQLADQDKRQIGLDFTQGVMKLLQRVGINIKLVPMSAIPPVPDGIDNLTVRMRNEQLLLKYWPEWPAGPIAPGMSYAVDQPMFLDQEWVVLVDRPPNLPSSSQFASWSAHGSAWTRPRIPGHAPATSFWHAGGTTIVQAHSWVPQSGLTELRFTKLQLILEGDRLVNCQKEASSVSPPCAWAKQVRLVLMLCVCLKCT